MKLHSMLSDGMVLQRDTHVPIWERQELGRRSRFLFLEKHHTAQRRMSPGLALPMFVEVARHLRHVPD
ncbi:hypothetical protein [Paenibacillus lentus]|nr:hypothetical protein [Paenibacillus lentus]